MSVLTQCNVPVPGTWWAFPLTVLLGQASIYICPFC